MIRAFVLMSAVFRRVGMNGEPCMVVFQAEDGIRDLVRSRGLGDVYKRQELKVYDVQRNQIELFKAPDEIKLEVDAFNRKVITCLLYTSDAADERSSVDLGGRRIIKKKNARLDTRTH